MKKIVLAAGISAATVFAAPGEADKPVLPVGRRVHDPQYPLNVIIFMADDMGYECLGANGCEDYRTPVLDQLAAEGVLFEQCFANPKCTPSRVKLMTGKYNSRNYVKFGVLDRSQTTFGHIMKKAGYATAIAGKWQLGHKADSPQHFGFDQSCLWQHTRWRKKEDGSDTRYPNPWLEFNGVKREYQNGEYGPDICAQFICDFIESNKERPFFVYYPMILPHWPWVATPDSPDWDPTHTGSRENKPGTPEEQKRHFGEMVTYADKLVGQIVRTLEENGVRENTLLIFVGDNGTDDPIVTRMAGRDVAGAKGEVKDEGTRVPCIVNWKGTVKPAVQRNELVELSDFLPTLCDLTPANLPADYPADGISLAPVLTGDGVRDKSYIYMLYQGESWARNQTHGVKLMDGKKELLEKYSDHYKVETVDSNSAIDERDNAVFKTLRKKVDDLSSRRDEGLLWKAPEK